MQTMTDAELRTAMKAIASVNGLTLSAERIDGDAAQFKSLLAAVARIQRVELPVDAEPAVSVTLDRPGR
jgi:hypothetical protein